MGTLDQQTAMSRRPARFTEADVRRVRKAAPDRIVEIAPDGTIRILPPNEKTEKKGKLESEQEIVL